MNTKEDNKQQGKVNTHTQEAELVVELNSDILKTIQSLLADLQSFKDDKMNKRKNNKQLMKPCWGT